MPIDWFPLWLSLRVAAISTAIALALGLWLAWILANQDFRGKEPWTPQSALFRIVTAGLLVKYQRID